MKWLLTEPRYGDMIRVKSGTVYHYGVYVSDDEVIQFGLAPAARPALKDSEVEVLSTDIDTFLSGQFFLDGMSMRRNYNRRSIRGYELLRNALPLWLVHRRLFHMSDDMSSCTAENIPCRVLPFRAEAWAGFVQAFYHRIFLLLLCR